MIYYIHFSLFATSDFQNTEAEVWCFHWHWEESCIRLVCWSQWELFMERGTLSTWI